MFLEQRDLLRGDEITRLRQLAEKMRFVDGRVSNPANTTKVNQQADFDDLNFSESSQIVIKALQRNPEFQLFAFPRKIIPPILSRYEPGMKYGAHADTAFMRMPSSDALAELRSDLSCTVFISDPKSYDGGELVLHMGTRPMVIKGSPGEAFVYPSTTLHEVRPVLSGVRLVSVTFIESRIANSEDRNTLFELADILSREGLKMDWVSRVRMDVVIQNLKRRWSTPC